MRRELAVWMNGERVGVWSQGRTGYHRFAYDEAWVRSPRARALSLSLPITASRAVEGTIVESFFDNLLPDSDAIRRRLRDRFRTGSTAAYDLLEAIGRDCAGAIELLPPEENPAAARIESDPLDEAGVARVLRNVTSSRKPGDRGHDGSDLRISIAGAQEKTALLRLDGRWRLPRGATPTTHILKLPLGLVGGRRLDLSHSVENEWLCLGLLRSLGIPVADAEISRFAGEKALVVERFDRRLSSNRRWIVRLPQEDFCQALGVPAALKYEADGGPGMRDCLDLLAHSESPEADRRTFVCAQFCFWLLAATDGHAKNFSLFLEAGDRYRLTPLYDVVSVWPVVGDGPDQLPWKRVRLAMAMRSKNAHYRPSEILPRHWRELALRAGGESLWRAIVELAERAGMAVRGMEGRLPADFPPKTAEAIFRGVRSQAETFQAGVAE